MKKIAVVAVLVGSIIMGFSVMAKAADSVQATVPLTLTIPAQFGFTLDKYAWDFGTVETGKGAETTIAIFCRSNHGRKWYMGLQAAEFQNGAGDKFASDPGFTMVGWGAPVGDPGYAGGIFVYKGAVPSASMYDFYESTVAEGGDPFTSLTLALYIKLPSAQASGLYSTNLILTMHD